MVVLPEGVGEVVVLPEGVGEVGQGRQTVDQVVGHVEELELVGSGREGGAHDQVHLDRRQHRAQRVQLRSGILASTLDICTSKPCWPTLKCLLVWSRIDP